MKRPTPLKYEPKPLLHDAHDDQAEPGPGAEPAVQELQLGCARELEEAEGGAERGETAIVSSTH